MTGQHLKTRLDQAGTGLPDLARRLRISPHALDQRLASQDIRVSVLVEITNATDKQIVYFLEGYTPQPGVNYEADLEQTTRHSYSTSFDGYYPRRMKRSQPLSRQCRRINCYQKKEEMKTLIERLVDRG